MRLSHRVLAVLLPSLLASTIFSAAASAADLESQINARWKGGWVVVKAPISSDCNGFFTDNDANGSRVTSRGDVHFKAGELAHVERVGVTWTKRVDVFLDVAEQILDSHRDGPFTLYDPRSCKAQLKIDGAGKRGLQEAEQALGALLELHAQAPEAEASPAWNGRRRPDYPADYQKTLAQYAVWKATQVNAAVQARLQQAVDDAVRANDKIRDDPDYLAGFAAGVERIRHKTFGECPSLIESGFYPDTERGKPERWGRGYEDGQDLAYSLELLRRLRDCFVPVPPSP